MHRRGVGLPRAIGFIPLLVMIALLGVWLSGCSVEETHEFSGAVLENPEPLPDFTLTATGDEPVSLSDFRDKYVMLYFGYTYCPDFCPTTLAKLAKVHKELGDDADQMQVVMVTVDPERDTADLLGRYVGAFNPDFVGLTGTKEEIDEVGAAYGLYYKQNEGSAATGYLVDHSTRTYLIGPDGRALVAYPHEATPEGILSDLQWLLAQQDS